MKSSRVRLLAIVALLIVLGSWRLYRVFIQNKEAKSLSIPVDEVQQSGNTQQEGNEDLDEVLKRLTPPVPKE